MLVGQHHHATPLRLSMDQIEQGSRSSQLWPHYWIPEPLEHSRFRSDHLKYWRAAESSYVYLPKHASSIRDGAPVSQHQQPRELHFSPWFCFSRQLCSWLSVPS